MPQAACRALASEKFFRMDGLPDTAHAKMKAIHQCASNIHSLASNNCRITQATLPPTRLALAQAPNRPGPEITFAINYTFPPPGMVCSMEAAPPQLQCGCFSLQNRSPQASHPDSDKQARINRGAPQSSNVDTLTPLQAAPTSPQPPTLRAGSSPPKSALDLTCLISKLITSCFRLYRIPMTK